VQLFPVLGVAQEFTDELELVHLGLALQDG
jgi:hypothetical protein